METNKTENQCHICGRLPFETVKGQIYCIDCFEKVFAYCSICNEILLQDAETTEYVDWQIVCRFCYEELYKYCSYCGQDVLQEDFNSDADLCLRCDDIKSAIMGKPQK